MTDWSDFEPQTEREQLAYSLMVAGVTVDPPGDEDGVLLDYELTDRVLEELHARGYVIVRGWQPASKREAARAERIVELPRINEDGKCSGCGLMVSVEGRCNCLGGRMFVDTDPKWIAASPHETSTEAG